MEERRGPEYIRASAWQAKRKRTHQRTWWMLGPAAGIAAGIIFVQFYLPQRAAANTVTRLIRRLPHVFKYHAIEYRMRADGSTSVLREEFSQGQERRVELFGSVVLLSQEGLVFERATQTLRSFNGASLANTAPMRLASDLYAPTGTKISVGSNHAIIVQTPTRKVLLKMDEQGTRPTEWITYYKTERGFEPLSRTLIEYGDQRPALFTTVGLGSGKPVAYDEQPDPFAKDAKPIQTFRAGENEYSVLRADVNSRGDLIVLGSTNLDRPFVEIHDDQGHHFAPNEMYGSSIGEGGPVYSQQLGIRLEDTPLKWPVTYTFSVRSYDPRYKVGGSANVSLGTYKVTFAKPTCYLSPTTWFGTYAADKPYFDFERTRHYRLALMYQNAMRTNQNVLVDTLNGGAADTGDANLHKNPRDTETAIDEMREVIRSRAEFDSGTLTVAALYISLAELYQAADRKPEALASLQIAKEEKVRAGIADPTLDASIDRMTQELQP